MIFTLFPIENFPNEVVASIFSILFIVIIIFELRIALRCKNMRNDNGSFILIICGISLPLILMSLLAYSNYGRMNSGISYFGLVILILGLILRQYSIAVLGRFFVPVVYKQKGQRIIQEGPYKHLRHPSYTGLFLELLGGSLALSNWISVIAVLILFLPAIIYRMNVEEEFLINEFKDYKRYMKRTRRLFPFVY